MVARLKGRGYPREKRTLRLVHTSRPEAFYPCNQEDPGSRVERLRQDYLKGALRVDTHEVARRMLIRLLN